MRLRLKNFMEKNVRPRMIFQFSEDVHCRTRILDQPEAVFDSFTLLQIFVRIKYNKYNKVSDNRQDEFHSGVQSNCYSSLSA